MVLWSIMSRKHLPPLPSAASELERFADAKAGGRRTVLFVCTGNAARSQMAESLVNHHLGDAWAAFSAGTVPMMVHPLAMAVMQEDGIDMTGKTTKHIDQFKDCFFDRVVLLCSDVERCCPSYPYPGNKVSIIFHDPAVNYALLSPQTYRRLREELKDRILPYLRGL